MLRRLVPDVDDENVVTRLRRVVLVVLFAGLLACAGESGNGPADPELLGPGETQGPVTSRVPLPGFDDVVVEVRSVDGQVLSWCLLLAETDEQRRRGLMEVSDPALGGYDGMLFRFEADSTTGFWMRNTPQPLDIAYVGGDGMLVSQADMVPCEDRDDCPNYPALAPYRWAVEVPTAVGGIERLGLVPGAVLVDTGRACSA